MSTLYAVKSGGFALKDDAGGIQKVSEESLAATACHAELSKGAKAALWGQIPPWFGLDLFDYQLSAAIRLDELSLLADPPGLGKTRTSLAAAARKDAKRLVIVCPPVVAASWAREASVSNVANPLRPKKSERIGGVGINPPGPHVKMIQSSKPLPDLPDIGIVVVPDSMLGARKDIVKMLVDWAPDFMIIDEVHRLKTWKAARSKAVKKLSRGVPKVLALSGTPLLGKVYEITNVLDITGDLTGAFGGYGAFCRKYLWQTPWGEQKARKKMIPHLKQVLDEDVWVRREREDVLKDLPEHLSSVMVLDDLSLKDYEKAYEKVTGEIDQWIKDFGPRITPAMIDGFCADPLPMISLLREAAGLAKIPKVSDMAKEWVSDHPASEDGTYSDPLLIWTHHREVTNQTCKALKEVLGEKEVGIIIGGTSPATISRTVDAFQAGHLAALVASIHAGGVGITLTRGNFHIFAEADWTPAIIEQAQRRQNRISQTRTTRSLTLIAAGTLDEHLEDSLDKKATELVPLLGKDADQAVLEGDLVDARSILRGLVTERVRAASESGD